MRWFWLVVGLLGIGAVVVTMMGQDEVAVESGARTSGELRVMAPIVIGGVRADESEPVVAEDDVVVQVDNAEIDGSEDEGGDGGSDEGGVEVMGDGSLMLAGRYRVTGRGTADDPYTVNWDLLKSAEEGYAPVMGKTEIPEWIEMLGGMYVRIDGFMMNPTLEAEVKEFLLMKNSWDACCLGLPPTPYDSMEVAMGEAARMPELLHARASVTGRLGVSPSLVAGRFLTGLYTLDDARAEFRAGL